jgi:hypothetical protein
MVPFWFSFSPPIHSFTTSADFSQEQERWPTADLMISRCVPSPLLHSPQNWSARCTHTVRSHTVHTLSDSSFTCTLSYHSHFTIGKQKQSRYSRIAGSLGKRTVSHSPLRNARGRGCWLTRDAARWKGCVRPGRETRGNCRALS